MHACTPTRVGESKSAWHVATASRLLLLLLLKQVPLLHAQQQPESLQKAVAHADTRQRHKQRSGGRSCSASPSGVSPRCPGGPTPGREPLKRNSSTSDSNDGKLVLLVSFSLP